MLWASHKRNSVWGWTRSWQLTCCILRCLCSLDEQYYTLKYFLMDINVLMSSLDTSHCQLQPLASCTVLTLKSIALSAIMWVWGQQKWTSPTCKVFSCGSAVIADAQGKSLVSFWFQTHQFHITFVKFMWFVKKKEVALLNGHTHMGFQMGITKYLLMKETSLLK